MGVVIVNLHTFLTSKFDEGKWLPQCFCRFASEIKFSQDQILSVLIHAFASTLFPLCYIYFTLISHFSMHLFLHILFPLCLIYSLVNFNLFLCVYVSISLYIFLLNTSILSFSVIFKYHALSLSPILLTHLSFIIIHSPLQLSLYWSRNSSILGTYPTFAVTWSLSLTAIQDAKEARLISGGGKSKV